MACRIDSVVVVLTVADSAELLHVRHNRDPNGRRRPPSPKDACLAATARLVCYRSGEQATRSSPTPRPTARLRGPQLVNARLRREVQVAQVFTGKAKIRGKLGHRHRVMQQSLPSGLITHSPVVFSWPAAAQMFPSAFSVMPSMPRSGEKS